MTETNFTHENYFCEPEIRINSLKKLQFSAPYPTKEVPKPSVFFSQTNTAERNFRNLQHFNFKKEPKLDSFRLKLVNFPSEKGRFGCLL